MKLARTFLPFLLLLASCGPAGGGPAAELATLEVSVATPTIGVGEATPATAVAYDVNGNAQQNPAVQWSSSDTAVAAVNEQGVITGESLGPVTITATAGGLSDAVDIAVVGSSNTPPGLTWGPTTGVLSELVAGFAILPDGTWLIWTAGLADGTTNLANGGSVSVSTNEGDDWTRISNGLPICSDDAHTGLIPHPEDPNLVLATCGGDVYRSTDQGVTWSQAHHGTMPAPEYRRHDWLTDTLIRYADIASSDAGATWHDIRYPENIVSSSHPATWWAIDAESAHKTTDAGATWSDLSENVTSPNVSGTPSCEGPLDVVGATALPDGSWHLVATRRCDSGSTHAYADVTLESDDEGNSWAATSDVPTDSPAFPFEGSHDYRLTVNPGDPQNFHVTRTTSAAAVFASLDGGASWSSASPGTQAVREVRYLPNNPDVIILEGVENTANYKSTDKGSSWDSDRLCSSSGGRTYFGPEVVTVTHAPDVAYFDSCVTNDAGLTWEPVPRYYIHHLGRQYAYGTGSGNGHLVRAPYTAPASLGPEFALSRGLGVTPMQHLRVSAAGELYASQHLTLPGATARNVPVAVVTADPAAGDPWRQELIGPVAAQAPSDPNRWYVFIEGETRGPTPDVYPPRVHVANGDPATWPLDSGTALPGNRSATKLVVSHQDEDVVYATTAHAIFKSTDGARTWREASGALGNEAEILELVIDPTNELTLYTATPGGIFVTHDEGTTWADITGDLTLTRDVVDIEISGDGSILYAALQGDGVIRRAGGAWVRVAQDIGTEKVHDIALDPSDAAAVYLATDAGVWKSINYGVTWAPVNAGLPFSKVVNLAVAPAGGTVYALAQDPASNYPALSGALDLGTHVYVGVPSERTEESGPLSGPL